MMEIVSKANSVRISPKKLRKVADLVRGLNVNKALNSLSHMDEKGAAIILKTLSSAIANAENNFQYDIDKLFVKEAYCGKQITMKRFRPRAKGRAAPILKPYSNLTIILSEKLQTKEVKDGTKG